MCVRVEYSALCPTDPWDPSARVITLPATLSVASTNVVVRAVLSSLAVEQPSSGAVCFCGAPVGLLPRIPQQRTKDTEVMIRGA